MIFFLKKQLRPKNIVAKVFLVLCLVKLLLLYSLSTHIFKVCFTSIGNTFTDGRRYFLYFYWRFLSTASVEDQ